MTSSEAAAALRSIQALMADPSAIALMQLLEKRLAAMRDEHWRTHYQTPEQIAEAKYRIDGAGEILTAPRQYEKELQATVDRAAQSTTTKQNTAHDV